MLLFIPTSLQVQIAAHKYVTFNEVDSASCQSTVHSNKTSSISEEAGVHISSDFFFGLNFFLIFASNDFFIPTSVVFKNAMHKLVYCWITYWSRQSKVTTYIPSIQAVVSVSLTLKILHIAICNSEYYSIE